MKKDDHKMLQHFKGDITVNYTQEVKACFSEWYKYS